MRGLLRIPRAMPTIEKKSKNNKYLRIIYVFILFKEHQLIESNNGKIESNALFILRRYNEMKFITITCAHINIKI